MLEIILTAITGFILGVVFVRFWDGWITRKRLNKCLDEIVRKKTKLSLGNYSPV